ncbi:hypothetical protein D9M69_643010 [compost metagenome]
MMRIKAMKVNHQEDTRSPAGIHHANSHGAVVGQYQVNIVFTKILFQLPGIPARIKGR